MSVISDDDTAIVKEISLGAPDLTSVVDAFTSAVSSLSNNRLAALEIKNELDVKLTLWESYISSGIPVTTTSGGGTVSGKVEDVKKDSEEFATTGSNGAGAVGLFVLKIGDEDVYAICYYANPLSAGNRVRVRLLYAPYFNGLASNDKKKYCELMFSDLDESGPDRQEVTGMGVHLEGSYTADADNSSELIFEFRLSQDLDSNGDPKSAYALFQDEKYLAVKGQIMVTENPWPIVNFKSTGAALAFRKEGSSDDSFELVAEGYPFSYKLGMGRDFSISKNKAGPVGLCSDKNYILSWSFSKDKGTSKFSVKSSGHGSIYLVIDKSSVYFSNSEDYCWTIKVVNYKGVSDYGE